MSDFSSTSDWLLSPATDATNAISVATAPTHTAVANSVTRVVARRRIIVAQVTVTPTRGYGCGCGRSRSRIPVSRRPTIERCGLGAFQRKKRRCDDQSNGNCAYPHLKAPSDIPRSKQISLARPRKHSGETRKGSLERPGDSEHPPRVSLGGRSASRTGQVKDFAYGLKRARCLINRAAHIARSKPAYSPCQIQFICGLPKPLFQQSLLHARTQKHAARLLDV
jgi:hypothetical protein